MAVESPAWNAAITSPRSGHGIGRVKSIMANEKILVDVRRIREQITEWYNHGSGLERSILKDVLDLLDKEAEDGIAIRVGDKYVSGMRQLVAELKQPRVCSMEVRIDHETE